MHTITVKRSESQLKTAVRIEGSQFNEQPMFRVNGRVEIGDYRVPPRRAPKDAKHVNRDIEYDDDKRHWSPNSQPYAPGDILFQYLRDGWLLADKVIIQTVQCFSRRCVEVYYFRLMTGSEHVLMPIIANPVILRLVTVRGLVTIRVSTDDAISDLSQPQF